MGDQTVTLRITGDLSGLKTAVTDAKAQIDSLGTAGAAMGQQVATGTNAATAGLVGVKAAAAAATASLGSIGSGGGGATAGLASTANASNALAGSFRVTGGVAREFGVLLGETLSGNFGRLRGSLVTMANQLRLMPLLFSPIGLAVAALGVGLGALIYYSIQTANQLNALGKAIQGTNGYTQESVQGLVDLEHEMKNLGVSSKDAQTSVLSLAQTGRFFGTELEQAALGAAAFSEISGKAIKETIKDFEELTKDPVQGLIKLNEQTHLLTETQIAQVATLEAQGNKFGAVALAINYASTATQEAAKKQDDYNKELKIANDLIEANAQLGNEQIPELALEIQARVAAAKAADAQAQSLKSLDLVGQESAAHFSASNAKQQQQLQELVATYGKGKTGLVEYQTAQEIAAVTSQVYAAAILQLIVNIQKGMSIQTAFITVWAQASSAIAVQTKNIKDQMAANLALAKTYDGLVAAKKNQHELSQEVDQFNTLLQKNTTLEEGFAAAGGEYAAAITKRDAAQKASNDLMSIANDLMNKSDATLAKVGLSHAKLTDAIGLAAQVSGQANNAWLNTNAILDQQALTLGGLTTKYEDEIREANLVTEAQKEIAKAVDEGTKYWTDHQKAMEHNGITLDMVQEKMRTLGTQLAATREQVRLNTEAAQGWQQVWSTALNNVGDLFAKTLVEGGSLFNGLKDLAKQTVEAIISYFVKLQFINPLLNSIFGGQLGFQTLPTGNNTTALEQTGSQLAQQGVFNYITGQYEGGGSGGGVAGLIGSVGSGGGGLGSLLSPSTWSNLGGNLASGFQSFWSGAPTAGQGVFDSATSIGSNGGFNFATAGTGTAGSTGLLGSSYGGSTFGQVLGAAGGLFAAYNEFKQAGGGLSGTAGAAAYGLGTYALGAGLTGAATGAGFAAGVGGAFAIPVVGWVALAAMLIDKFSGGKLFGTAYQPTGNVAQNLSVGPGGADISNSAEEKKNGALFSGHSWRWEDIASTPEEQQFQDSVTKAMQQVANSAAGALGQSAADLVVGSFKQVTDKTGKVTSQISTVLGQTFSEPIEDFVTRMQALNVGAQIDKALGTNEATTILQTYNATAASISDAAQMLLAAQEDVQHSLSLLGSDTSLTHINEVVSQLQQSGESLLQTYQRLQQETQALQGALDMMGIDLGKSGEDFVKFADAAATAAGGVDNLTTLLQSYQKNYFTGDQIAQQTIAAYQKQASSSLSAIGLDPSTTMEQFKDQFTQVMASLSPDQLVQWLQAANYLAQATEAQQAYNDALAQNAANIQQILSQINPNVDPKAGTLDATYDQINASYDQAIAKLKSYGATALQIAEAEDDRETALFQARQNAEQNYASIVAGLQNAFTQLNHPQSAFQSTLIQISQALASTTAQLNAAAKAAGMQAAREEDLALVHQYAAAQAAVAAKQLEASTKDLVSQLYGSQTDDIATSANVVSASLSSFAQGISNVGDAVNKFKDSMLIDSTLSPLNAQQQLDEALRQLRQTGDSATAQRALEIARGLTASGDDYKKLFDEITGLVRNTDSSSNGGRGGGGGGSSSQTAQLTDAQRLQDAQQLAQNVADLSGFDGKTFADVAKEENFNLSDLAKDLGLTQDGLNDYLKSLEADSYNIDDLSTLITSQVDRIVAAIRGENFENATTNVHTHPGIPGRVVTFPDSSTSTTTDPLNVSTSRAGSGTISTFGGDAVVATKLDTLNNNLVQAMAAVAKVIASTGVANEDATLQVVDKVRGIEVNTRGFNDGPRLRSTRTPSRVIP